MSDFLEQLELYFSIELQHDSEDEKIDQVLC